METLAYIEKRHFELRNVSEDEARILYALANYNDDALWDRIRSECGGDMPDDELRSIAYAVRDKILAMIDGE